MRTQDFINKLRGQGRSSFTLSEMEQSLGINKMAALNALHRLRAHQGIASPARGFYLILPPEYHALGCLPPEALLPELMRFLQLPYYVGYLSAAPFYGITFEKPQPYQVVTLKNRPSIYCGHVTIEFIANKKVAALPVQQVNTATGMMTVATPETLAVDILTSPHQTGEIQQTIAILKALASQMNNQRLIELSQVNTELFWLQRLGYLLEIIGFYTLANTITHIIGNRKTHWVRLVSHTSYIPLSRNKKWKIIVNTAIEK